MPLSNAPVATAVLMTSSKLSANLCIGNLLACHHACLFVCLREFDVGLATLAASRKCWSHISDNVLGVCIHNRSCDCVACILQRRPDYRAPLTRCRAVVNVDDARQKNRQNGHWVFKHTHTVDLASSRFEIELLTDKFSENHSKDNHFVRRACNQTPCLSHSSIL